MTSGDVGRRRASARAGGGEGGVIAALGTVQILAWGTSFYLLAVLAAPIAADTGWPLDLVVGGLSLGLLVAGLVSPRIGLLIDAGGGRRVLMAGCALLALGLAILAAAPNLAVFVLGWCIIGAGMAASLYDAAFATLARLYGASARRAITSLTLWGGFASTICWPVSAFLAHHVGWRGTCLVYAAVQAFVCVPLLAAFLPGRTPGAVAGAGPDGAEEPAHARMGNGLLPSERAVFLLMCALVTVAGAIAAIVSVHLLMLLQAKGQTLAAAVALGAVLGPSQVFARLVEKASGGRHHPLWTLSGAVALIALGLVLLAAGFPVVSLALVAYGAGNGVYSIARGAVPLALFGPERYPALVGRLARPALLAQALAPVAGAFAVTLAGAEALLAALAVLAVANVGLAAALWRLR